MTAGEPCAATSLSFSCDGALLAGGSYAGPIRIWDATMGALLRTIPAAEAHLLGSVHFSATKSRLLTTGGGYDIGLWDVDSGDKVGSIEGRRFAVFSPDGRTIATACPITLREVRVVDVESGALRSTTRGHENFLSSHEGYLSAASFSVDTLKMLQVPSQLPEASLPPSGEKQPVKSWLVWPAPGLAGLAFRVEKTSPVSTLNSSTSPWFVELAAARVSPVKTPPYCVQRRY